MERLNHTILREIGSLGRTIHAICDIKYKALNVHKGNFLFLTRICENEGLSLKELSIMLKMDKTTTTKAVKKLIDSGYASKERDKEDQRIWRLYPTEKAEHIYDTVITEENRAIEKCLEGFTHEEKVLVEQLILRMKDNIASDWYEIKHYQGGKK